MLTGLADCYGQLGGPTNRGSARLSFRAEVGRPSLPDAAVTETSGATHTTDLHI